MIVPSRKSNLGLGGFKRTTDVRSFSQDFQLSLRRRDLRNFARFLLINGSFVTRTATPNDIDMVVVLGANHDLTADLSPAQYNLVSRRRVQNRYGFDIVAVREESVEYQEAVVFFMQVRYAPALRKGMLRLVL
jgi:hypothetical protein